MPSSGPNSPSSGASVAGIGSRTWDNPSRVTSSDNSSAGVTTSASNGASEWLVATGFGFSIPAGSTIDGIYVEWERNAQYDEAGRYWYDNGIRIVKGGTVQSTDKSSASSWPTTDAYAGYGGASDLWGTTWTVADINGSGFGAALSVYTIYAFSASAGVDHCRITVYYTEAGGNRRRRTITTSSGG